MELTDEQWKVVEQLLPRLKSRADGKGPPRAGDRAILNGILWILRPPGCSEMLLGGIIFWMAKGNDGNLLQHTVEVEAAAVLLDANPEGDLHLVSTHAMAPFESLDPTTKARTATKFASKVTRSRTA